MITPPEFSNEELVKQNLERTGITPVTVASRVQNIRALFETFLEKQTENASNLEDVKAAATAQLMAKVVDPSSKISVTQLLKILQITSDLNNATRTLSTPVEKEEDGKPSSSFFFINNSNIPESNPEVKNAKALEAVAHLLNSSKPDA